MPKLLQTATTHTASFKQIDLSTHIVHPLHICMHASFMDVSAYLIASSPIVMNPGTIFIHSHLAFDSELIDFMIQSCLSSDCWAHTNSIHGITRCIVPIALSAHLPEYTKLYSSHILHTSPTCMHALVDMWLTFNQLQFIAYYILVHFDWRSIHMLLIAWL